MRTEELLRDFRHLTGAAYQPSLQEFLELRRQAIEECRLGLAEPERMPEAEPAPPAPAKKKTVAVPAPPEEDKPKEESRRKKETAMPKEPKKNEERNGFALLSELADPWN